MTTNLHNFQKLSCFCNISFQIHFSFNNRKRQIFLISLAELGIWELENVDSLGVVMQYQVGRTISSMMSEDQAQIDDCVNKHVLELS
jgi:hypothetical protein